MAIAAPNPIPTESPDLWPVLAQTARAARLANEVWFYLALLVIASIAIVIIGLVVRKMVVRPIEPAQGEMAFDLSELRRLHREGHLTDEEYQAARATALADSGILDDAPAPPVPIPARPINPDTDLGPELLDRANPPESPSRPDNPETDPQAPDNPPNN